MPPRPAFPTPEPEKRLPLGGALRASFLARAVGAAAAFGLHLLLARLAGAEQYGTYSYVLAWLGIAVLVAGLGLHLALVRYVAAYRAQAAWALLEGLWRWSRRLVLAAAGSIAAVAALLLWLLRDRLDPSLVATGWIACGALPVGAMFRLNEGRLLGLKRVAAAQLPEGLLRPVIAAGLAALLYALPGRPLGSAAAMGLHLVAILVALAVSLALARSLAPRPPPPEEARYVPAAWMRVSVPLWLQAGLLLVSSRLDVILVGVLAGMTDAGIYAVASRLAELIVFGADASQLAARPDIAEADARNDPQALQRAVTAAAGWATLFAAGACFFLIAGRSLLLGLFGAEFLRGAPVLLILTAGYLVAACTALADSVMNMTGHQAAGARISAAALAVKLPLIWVGVASWGIAGAALASSAAMIIDRLWRWIYVRRELRIEGAVFNGIRRRRSRLRRT